MTVALAGGLDRVSLRGNPGAGHVLLAREMGELSRLGEWTRNGAYQLFSSWRHLKIPAPPAYVLRLVNKSPSQVPQAVSHCCLGAVSWVDLF